MGTGGTTPAYPPESGVHRAYALYGTSGKKTEERDELYVLSPAVSVQPSAFGSEMRVERFGSLG